MGTIQAVIFDFDDTLRQTRENSFRNLEEIARRKELSTPQRDIFDDNYSKNWEDIVHAMWPEADVEDLVKFNREEGPFVEYPAFPRAVATIDFLKEEMDLTLGIVSSGSSYKIRAKVSDSGFNPANFLFIHGREDTEVQKPDPHVFLPAKKVLAERGISLGRSIYVGDSPKDFSAAAQTRQIWPVVVTTGYHDRHHFMIKEGVDPDFILDSVAEVPGLVMKLNEMYWAQNNPK